MLLRRLPNIFNYKNFRVLARHCHQQKLGEYVHWQKGRPPLTVSGIENRSVAVPRYGLRMDCRKPHHIPPGGVKFVKGDIEDLAAVIKKWGEEEGVDVSYYSTKILYECFELEVFVGYLEGEDERCLTIGIVRDCHYPGCGSAGFLLVRSDLRDKGLAFLTAHDIILGDMPPGSNMMWLAREAPSTAYKKFWGVTYNRGYITCYIHPKWVPPNYTEARKYFDSELCLIENLHCTDIDEIIEFDNTLSHKSKQRQKFVRKYYKEHPGIRGFVARDHNSKNIIGLGATLLGTRVISFSPVFANKPEVGTHLLDILSTTIPIGSDVSIECPETNKFARDWIHSKGFVLAETCEIQSRLDTPHIEMHPEKVFASSIASNMGLSLP